MYIKDDTRYDTPLKDNIHKILARKYAIPILKELNIRKDGMKFREIDIEVVGVEGSPTATNMTLKLLCEIGWIEKDKKYKITSLGTEALDYVRKGNGML